MIHGKQERFKRWMLEQDNKSPSTTNSYVTYLNTVQKILKFKKNYHIPFFSYNSITIKSVEVAYQYLGEILESKDFSDIEHPERFGHYMAAIQKYIEFLKQDGVAFQKTATPVDSSVTPQKKGVILLPKITEENVNRIVDEKLLNQLFTAYAPSIFPDYHKTPSIFQDSESVKCLENETSFLVIILEPKHVTEETYKKTIEFLNKAKKIVQTKTIVPIILAGKPSEENLLAELAETYNPEVIRQIQVKIFKIKLVLEN